MKTSSLRQVVVAMTIAVSAATVHGAWFASTDAQETAPIITISTWDFYEKGWTSATYDLAADPLTVRHSEDTIVAISDATVSLPAGLNVAVLNEVDLASLEIPVVAGANQYLHLLVSKPENLVGSWPVIGSGPIDPDDTDLAALDVDGSVGVHTVTTDAGGSFTWDIGRWSKGDIFLGLNNHTYKVLDRNGNFKRFVASADYDQPADGEIYNVTTGCATNWKTGEVFATNFGDYRPAVNIIGRHPQADYVGDLSPYSSPTRRISTRIDRTDNEQGLYANEYTSLNYGIDTSPESVAFDADMNMYVGHSFGNFRQAPAAWQGDPNKVFEYDDEWTEYTMAVDGLPLEGWSWNDGWGWVVDETGVRMLLAPVGTTDPQAFTEKIYGTQISPRLAYNADGSLKLATASLFYPAIAGLPGWDPGGQLPESFLSDPTTGVALTRLNGGGALVPSRWSLGKRLHKYLVQNGSYQSTDAARDEFWTFSGRQGTDWIDLDVTGEVIYYTSEDSFIHRYRVKPGPNGEAIGQLPDVGVNLEVNGAPTFGKLAVASSPQDAISSGGGLLGDFRFHGLRILPPGDGSGGFLVAVENGLGVHRFNGDGKWVQRYYAHINKDGNPQTGDGGKEHLVSNWYTLEVDPGGKSFWASAHDNGWVVEFDIASGRVLKEIDAVNYVPQGDPIIPEGRRVEGICVMWEYTAPQEICFNPDGTEQGLDDDGDGYVDENCVAIEVCSAVSPGDDDGDGLSDQYDSDCSAELPPVATDDAYAINQQDPAQPSLTVTAASGVLQLGPVPDYDRDSGVYADIGALSVTSFGANEGSLTLTPGDTLTTPGVGTVVLQGDGSFVFTPDPAFHGVFSFAYKVTDGYPLSPDDREVPNDGEDDIATVTITVAPKVADDGIFSLWVGETLSQGGLLTNDPAQSTVPFPVTISEAGASGTPVAFTGSRTFQTAQSNSVTVNANGSFDFTASNLAYGGPDHFTYAVHNTVSRSWNLATVTFDVRRPVITIVVPDQVKTYDGAPLPTTCTVTSERVADPAYTLTYAGTIRGGAAYGPTTTAPTAAGTYTATCVHTDVALGPQSDTGTIVINPVPLVVTAADTTRPYLAPNPAVTRTITGFVNGETESVISGTTTCATSTPQSANVGTYTDVNTCSETLSATNYTFSYVPGDLTVTGLVLTVTAANTEKFYGDPNPAVTYDITGFQGGDTAATVVNGTTTCSTTGGANAGTYAGANTCTPTLTATNYTFVYVPGNLIVNKVPLVVTASDTTRPYLAANPAVTRTITGFVNGETESVLTGTTTCSTSTPQSANVGTYADANTCSETLSSPNYDISYVPGDLTVTALVLTVTASSTEKFYGDPTPAVTYDITGFQGGDTAATAVTGTTACSTSGGTNAGTYAGANTCTPTLAATNYTFVYVPGDLIIKKVPLVVTAADTTRPYLAANPAVTRTITGFVNGETEAVLTGTTTCSTSTPQSANVGTYADANTCSETLSSPNYDISYVPGDLTITGLVLTVTAANTEKFYGDPNPAVTYDITGFQGDDTAATAVTGTTACSTSGGTNAGTYAGANTCTPTLTATNYTFVYVPGDLVIKKAPLVVTAADTTRPYLAANPTVTRTITGFVNGETEAVLTGTTTCSTSTPQSANVGTYADANTCTETLSSPNYDISYVPGDLTVTGFVLTVTASNTEKFYGDPNPAVTYDITGFQGDDTAATVVNGTTTCSTAGGTNAGTYAGANTCTPTLTATNYTFVYVPGDLIIKKVPLVVTAATTTKVYGDPNPAVTRTIGGFVNGDDAGDLGGTSVCSTSASAGPNVGSYDDANTCTQNLTSPNYTFTYVPGDFSITPRPLTVQANDKTMVLGSPLPPLDGTLTGTVVTGDVINVAYVSTNPGTVVGQFPNVIVPSVTAGGTTLLTNYTITLIPGTLTVVAAPCSGDDGYTTYSQGGWGSKPSGGNPGALLATHFDAVYPNGVVIGGTYTLTFTSASAIEAFLPAGGPSRPLTASAVNPTSSAAGNIGAQLLALRLATDFSAAGVTKRGLGSLVMQSGPLAGQTVNQILDLANAVVGGQSSALPSGLSISELSSILESLNLNYHEGTENQGLLSCGGTPPCSPTELSFTGSSSVSGTAGNIRTFSAGGVSVKASAFSRVKGTNGAWAPAYLGVWNEGLGVTDTSESGSNNTHKIDNNGRLNYVLFEFSEPVIVSRAYLDSISGDSDATIWVGTKASPYTNHITLSDAVLASLGAAESSSGGSSARWAEFNGDAVVGNVIVIAANVAGSNDSFKVSKLQLECGAVAPEPDPVAPTIAATGGTFVYSGDSRAGTCSVTGANNVALPGTLSYTPGPSAPSQVGNYTVTCSFAGDAFYTPATATATLTITPAPLTVAANDKTKTQGTQNPELDGTLTGVVGGDVITAGYTTTATTASPVGSYPIVPILSDPAGRLSNYTVTTVNGVLTVTPAVAACSADGYLTYSQGGWGSSPSGNNPGAFLAANFDRVYGSDGVVIGGNRTLTFTSARAIERFLPQGGRSNVLNASATDPRRSSAGNFAAQLLALRLAVDFSAAGVTQRGLGGLVMQSGPLAGMTVDAILVMSNTVIGGTTSALPQGMSLSTLSSILESLNMNYHEGTDNRGRLGCGGAPLPVH